MRSRGVVGVKESHEVKTEDKRLHALKEEEKGSRDTMRGEWSV